jgi:ribosomal protein L11 methyltransferase
VTVSSQGAPRFPFLAVEAPADRADDLAYELMMLGAAGVDIQDDTTFVKGPGDGKVRLVASFASAEEARRVQAELAGSSGDSGLVMRVDELVGDEWRDAYKEHFKPFSLTKSLVVVPPWEDYAARDGEKVLTLDPGRAFGTGLHDTTSLVAQQLEARREALVGAMVLDVGTGSGILALAALMLGADRAVAVDNDPDVIEVAMENAARCGLADRVRIDTTPIASVEGEFPVVLANIRAGVLLDMAEALVARVASGGLLVLSGVLRSEEDAVRSGFEAAGMQWLQSERRGDGDEGWVAIAMRRR